MREQPAYVVTEDIKSKTSPRRMARVRAAVADAAHDFAGVWPAADRIEVVGSGTYGGRPVAMIKIESRSYILSDGEHFELVVNIVRLLQVVVTGGNTQWPTVPGVGALTAKVSDGGAIWVRPNGSEFCEIGHLFTRTVFTGPEAAAAV